MSDRLETNIRPKQGDRDIKIPVSFDYNGGSDEYNKTKIIWGIVLGVIGIFLAIVIFGSNNGNHFLVRLLKFLVAEGIIVLILRYAVFGESEIRKQYSELDSTDSEKGFEELWGVYSKDIEYPGFVRFKNGFSGLFIRLNKDVTTGKGSSAEYKHHEAIGDALNIASRSGFVIYHMDYMDIVGEDNRIQGSFDSLINVSNPDLKLLMNDIFNYQKEIMNNRVTTFDVYMFAFKSNEVIAWEQIQDIIACFLDANYSSYRFLDQEEIRDLFKIVYNLHDFSVVETMEDVFGKESIDFQGINLVETKINGKIKRVGKTFAEAKEDLKDKKNKKKKPKKDVDDDEMLDLL